MKPTSNRFVTVAAAAISVITLSSSAFAATTWNGSASGSWATLGNWTSVIPTAADLVTYGAGGGVGTAVANPTQTLDGSYSVLGFSVGNNTASPIVINSGTGTNLLTVFGSGITLNSSSGGSFTVNADLALGAAQTWTTGNTRNITAANVDLGAFTLSTNIAGSGAIAINGVISGSGGVTRAGAGAALFTLANTANTFTGAVALVGGTTVINKLANGGSDSSLGKGTSAIALNGATLNYNGTTTDTTDRAIEMRASSIINNNGTGGQITFTATNVTQTLAASARTLTLGGSNANANNFGSILGDSGTGANITSLAKSGLGTWIVSGANGYTGLTTVSAGVLNIQNNTATGTTAGGVSVTSGAALQLQNNITVGAEALALNGTGISSTGALRNISGDNVWQGTVTLGSAARINSDSGTLTFNTAANSITGTNLNLALGGAAGGTVGGTITTGTGTLTKDGAGTWVLNGANNYTGSTVINQGVLRVTGSGVLGGATGSTGDAKNIWFSSSSANATIEFETSANLGAADQIRFRNTGGTSGTGGNLNYIGTTAQVVSKAIQCDTSIGVRLSSDSVGGSVDFSGSFANAAGRVVYLGGTGTGDNKVSGAISGSSILTKVDAGNWILSGASTYTGATTIAAGILSAANIVVSGGSSNLGNATSAVTLGAASTQGTLSYTGDNATYTRGFTIGGAGGGRLDVTTPGQTLQVNTGGVTGSGLFTVGGAGDTSIGANLTHNGGLTKVDAGTLTLSGTSTFTGGTQIDSGTLSLGHATNTLANTGAVNVNGGTLALGNNSDTVGAVTLTSGSITGGSGVLTGASYALDGAGATSVGAILGGSGALTKSNGGVATLTGANTYTGATTIAAGKLKVNGSTSASSAVGVSSGGTLGGSGTVGGDTTIASGGALAPGNSPGVLTVSGSTTFNSGSIFEWELDTAQSNPTTNRGTAYDGVNTTSVSGSGAIFKVLLTGTQDFSDSFWDQTRTWTDIFKSADGGTSLTNWAPVFSGGFQYSYNGTNVVPTSSGSFTLTGNSLTWSAVPEPSNALAGLLAASALLRRRRNS